MKIIVMRLVRLFRLIVIKRIVAGVATPGITTGFVVRTVRIKQLMILNKMAVIRMKTATKTIRNVMTRQATRLIFKLLKIVMIIVKGLILNRLTILMAPYHRMSR